MMMTRCVVHPDIGGIHDVDPETGKPFGRDDFFIFPYHRLVECRQNIFIVLWYIAAVYVGSACFGQ
jgi:hypothetical protein